MIWTSKEKEQKDWVNDVIYFSTFFAKIPKKFASISYQNILLHDYRTLIDMSIRISCLFFGIFQQSSSFKCGSKRLYWSIKHDNNCDVHSPCQGQTLPCVLFFLIKHEIAGVEKMPSFPIINSPICTCTKKNQNEIFTKLNDLILRHWVVYLDSMTSSVIEVHIALWSRYAAKYGIICTEDDFQQFYTGIPSVQNTGAPVSSAPKSHGVVQWLWPQYNIR